MKMIYFLKCLTKSIKITRWTTLIPFFIYIVFILLILTITFPIKSTPSSSSSSRLAFKSIISTLEPLSLSDRENINKKNIIIKDAAPDGLLSSKDVHDDDDKIKDDNTNLLNGKHFKNDKSKINAINHQQEQILKTVFHKSDKNNDKFLTIQEIAHFINERVKQHIDLAIRVNPIVFAEIDVMPHDGLISWDEYHKYFLMSRGYDEEYIRNHNEKRHIKLDRKTKEIIMKDKANWNAAARTESLSLTLDEFLTFRHPEASAANLLSIVDTILIQFDADGNDWISEMEFTEVITDDLDEKWRILMESKSVAERQAEFKYLIDKNKDGKADRSELLSYVDPRHPRYSVHEASELVQLADQNQDKLITIDEMLSVKQQFLESKMIESLDSLHEEY